MKEGTRQKKKGGREGKNSRMQRVSQLVFLEISCRTVFSGFSLPLCLHSVTFLHISTCISFSPSLFPCFLFFFFFSCLIFVLIPNKVQKSALRSVSRSIKHRSEWESERERERECTGESDEDEERGVGGGGKGACGITRKEERREAIVKARRRGLRNQTRDGGRVMIMVGSH